MKRAFGNTRLLSSELGMAGGVVITAVGLGLGETDGVGVWAGTAVCPAVMGCCGAVLRIAQLMAKTNRAATASHAAVRKMLLVI